MHSIDHRVDETISINQHNLSHNYKSTKETNNLVSNVSNV